MTERLYYTDSYQTEFEAEVVSIAAVSVVDEGGSKKEVAAVELSASFFYPTSGGQAFDTGTLGEWQVVDVIADKGGSDSPGRVLHVLDADWAVLSSKVTPRQTLHGVIDWPRRYDHMQQHSGQHLLSHAFFTRFGYETVSVHFGALESTLDLATNAIAESEREAVERYVNEIVYAQLPIKAYFVDESEIAELPLRRPPKVSGKIRVVEIDGIDYSACGGTHCQTTGELGPIKVLRMEKSRKNTRVAFVCGWLAHADYAQKHQLLSASAQLFTTEMAQVPGSIERLLEQNKALNRRLSGLVDDMLAVEVAKLAEMAQPIGSVKSYRVVKQVFNDREISEVKKLAGLLQEAHDDLVVLLGVCNEERLTAIFACGKNVAIDMGVLLRDALRVHGGNGGGRPNFAQGGNVDALHAQAILDSVATQLYESSHKDTTA